MTAGRLIRKKTFVLAALAAIGAIVLTAFLVQQAGPRSATAADHLDAPGPAPPPGGDGIGTDLTDVYAFQSPAHSANTVLIMNVNGLASTAGIGNGPGDDRAFAQAIPKVKVDVPVYYYFRVANGDDPVADVNIQVAFGKVAKDGSQDMRVKVLGTGKEIELEGSSTGFGKAPVVNHGPMGIKAFAGRRDDPFFFDLLGFINILGTGTFIGCGGPNDLPLNDTFRGQNVSSIVLELPSQLLKGGGDSNVGVWATTNVGTDQIDRMGRPAINTVFIPNNPLPPDRVSDGKSSLKNTFNHGNPSTDVATWTSEVKDTLKMGFGRTEADATALAAFLLPDILTFDTTSSAGFPNGRRLADDVIDTELNLLSAGGIPTDCVPNDNTFLSAFPYIGNPN